jgi:xeroderma pigmentosum group C-complementing protein
LNSKSSCVPPQQDETKSESNEEQPEGSSIISVDSSEGDEEEDDDDDEIDWETIELPPRFQDMPESTPDMYKDVEVVMQTSSQPVIKYMDMFTLRLLL